MHFCAQIDHGQIKRLKPEMESETILNCQTIKGLISPSIDA
jgi:hypothetical protein